MRLCAEEREGGRKEGGCLIISRFVLAGQAGSSAVYFDWKCGGGSGVFGWSALIGKVECE